jgi:Cu(I)/Ag(I) efflux system periplasmic protein CusF
VWPSFETPAAPARLDEVGRKIMSTEEEPMNASRLPAPRLVRVIALVVTMLAGMPALARAQAADVIDGQVIKVDPGAGKITIKHGPIPKLGMDEGMTMVFRAGDAAMLKSVKAGDKVRFAPDLVDGQFTVTKIQKAK